jgi:hypothetical protein
MTKMRNMKDARVHVDGSLNKIIARSTKNEWPAKELMARNRDSSVDDMGQPLSFRLDGAVVWLLWSKNHYLLATYQ